VDSLCVTLCEHASQATGALDTLLSQLRSMGHRSSESRSGLAFTGPSKGTPPRGSPGPQQVQVFTERIAGLQELLQIANSQRAASDIAAQDVKAQMQVLEKQVAEVQQEHAKERTRLQAEKEKTGGVVVEARREAQRDRAQLAEMGARMLLLQREMAETRRGTEQLRAVLFMALQSAEHWWH